MTVREFSKPVRLGKMKNREQRAWSEFDKLHLQRFREVARVGFVVGVFLALVQLDERGVCQVDGVALVHEAVDEPVPVEGGFDGEAFDALFVGFEGLADRLDVVGQFALEDNVFVCVEQGAVGVVAVQVESAVEGVVGFFHGVSPWVRGWIHPKETLLPFKVKRDGNDYHIQTFDI